MRATALFALTLFLFFSLSPPARACSEKLSEAPKKSDVVSAVEAKDQRPTLPAVKISVKLPPCEVILAWETRRDKPAPLFVSPSKTLTVWLKVKIAF